VPDETENRVVEGLLERDEGALRGVVDTHSAAVLGMARRVLGDSALAQEVAQDTFMAVWRRPGAFDPGRGTLRAFLLGIARNKAIDLVRKEQRLSRAKDALIAEAETQSGTSDDDETIERRDEITTALSQLSDSRKRRSSWLISEAEPIRRSPRSWGFRRGRPRPDCGTVWPTSRDI
jgi:RNA polymerase sigma-70 factor (ECF subfamily)